MPPLELSFRWCVDGGDWLVGKGPALIQWVQGLAEKKLKVVTTVDEILQIALPPPQKLSKDAKKKKESEMQLAIAVSGCVGSHVVCAFHDIPRIDKCYF